MEWIKSLPALNASLNALAGLFLLNGYRLIRAGRVKAHRRSMLTACAASLLFLTSYLFYHYHAGSTRFVGTGFVRMLYFTILLSHTILAVTVLPLAILSVVNGLRMNVAFHRKISRWTFPIWMYVSVTGVLVYFFLYHWFPSR